MPSTSQIITMLANINNENLQELQDFIKEFSDIII